MKKKFFVLLMSLTLMVAMMPLSVFATEVENGEVITPIGETGLYLSGDRSAVENEDYTLDTFEEETIIEIKTSGWEIHGENSDSVVIFTAESEDAKLEIGDLTISDFIFHTAVPGTVTIHGTAQIGSGDDSGVFALQNDITINGEGSLIIPDGYIGPVSSRNIPDIFLNLNNIYVHQKTDTVVTSMGAIYGRVIDIQGGHVIAESETASKEVNVGLFAYDDFMNAEPYINIADDAETFFAGKDAGLVFQPDQEIKEDKFLGSNENLTYDEVSKVNLPVKTEEFSAMGSDFLTLGMTEANGPALTVYHPRNKPVPEVHEVTFNYQDGVTPDLVKDVEDGKLIEQPTMPTREGYTFEGWYDNAEGEGNAYGFNEPVHMSFTLYAKWTKTDDPTPVPPTPPVNPSDNTGKGAQTGDMAMPIVFIVLGLAAGATAIILSRKAKNK